ncbi:helix-turn-helix domain-containing protein [Paucibacter sp. DJ2R-2]|uniref:helix-turn-helix domain-containing protein n=1 Tax=Paucibacter sp. DJ2R-2 TaxID=2893558 RepID=UPI0021E3C483|nr:helix-turn-helix transcriptional regulator [Paucibacter sp. DJ2R-2]MCV2439861.1 helix-turn-helix domain-containing protein [Paucibacter sp. DJ2R-2]
MAETKEDTARASSLLGTHLAAVRKDRGFSLRHVEELTKKAVSNAYLSQVESGKIQQPSPNILHALSAAYKISYEQLMAMAGYISAGKKRGADAPKPSALTELNLTTEEEIELLEYLQFRRAQKEKSSK